MNKCVRCNEEINRAAESDVCDKCFLDTVGLPEDVHIPQPDSAGMFLDSSKPPVYKSIDEVKAFRDRHGSFPEPAPEADSPYNRQVGGDWYSKLKIQPFQYTLANQLDGGQHTAIKYITRFKDKDGLKDLRKAKHVIDILIEHYYGENG